MRRFLMVCIAVVTAATVLAENAKARDVREDSES